MKLLSQRLVTGWLFNRLCTSQFVEHELAVLSPVSTATVEISQVRHDVEEQMHSFSTHHSTFDLVLAVSRSVSHPTATSIRATVVTPTANKLIKEVSAW